MFRPDEIVVTTPRSRAARIAAIVRSEMLLLCGNSVPSRSITSSLIGAPFIWINLSAATDLRDARASGEIAADAHPPAEAQPADERAHRIGLAVAPSRPNVLYAAVEAKSNGLCRSDDLGETWRLMSSGSGVTGRPVYCAQVVVDPRPGATGMISGDLVAKSAPDGYTLWFATSTQLLGSMMFQRNWMAKDYAPVCGRKGFGV